MSVHTRPNLARLTEEARYHMTEQNATTVPRERRPTRYGWLVTYIGGLLRTGYTGRMQFTVDFHRGSISHLRVAEVKEVPVQ